MTYGTDSFESCIFRPYVVGDEVSLDNNVDKASISNPVAQVGTWPTRVGLFDTSENDFMPGEKGTVFWNAPIRRYYLAIPILEFDPSAGLGARKCLVH